LDTLYKSIVSFSHVQIMMVVFRWLINGIALRCKATSYGASPAIWIYTMLPSTWHRWTCPA